jgi:hypothetical protein
MNQTKPFGIADIKKFKLKPERIVYQVREFLDAGEHSKTLLIAEFKKPSKAFDLIKILKNRQKKPPNPLEVVCMRTTIEIIKEKTDEG